MTDSIFNKEANVDGADQGPDDTPANYLETLVGEGKKYASIDELAKAYVHLDRFNERIKGENSGLRNELGSKAALEELVDKLSKVHEMKNATNARTDVSNQNSYNDSGEQHDTSGNGGKDNRAHMSQDEIAALVRKSLSEEQTRTTHETNRMKAALELKKAWGPDYITRLRQVQTHLGVSDDVLDTLARTSPDLFLNAVLGTSPRSNESPNSGTPPRSTTSLNSPGGMRAKEDWAYFTKIRKENPSKYWSPAVQNRMFELMEKGLLKPDT